MGDPARHLVLVGLMGVGKSTVGRRLAKELARPFADVDEQVELRAGATIPTLFERDGEGAFRLIETEVVADLLARPQPLVVAAGGGLVTVPANRAALTESGAFVVWLRASAGFLARRTDPTHRPLLAAAGTDPGQGGAGSAGDDGAARLEATLGGLLAERSALYEQVADVQVDVEPFHAGDDKPKRALARHIAALVGRAAAVGR
jgi:shikimate kinase